MTRLVIRQERFARTPSRQPGRKPSRAVELGGVRLRAGSAPRSAADVIAEVERVPGYAPHIPDPQPPVLLAGTRPADALAQAISMAERGCDRMGRRVKADAAIIMSVVVSYPRRWTEIAGNAAEAQRLGRWQELEIAFVQKEYGARIGSVVVHRDEPRPHLHCIILPRLVPHRLPDGREVELFSLTDADPVRRASNEARQATGRLRDAREAGRMAGSALQRRHAAAVGSELGLSAGDGRTGPRVSRLEAIIRAEVAKRTEALTAELQAARQRELELDQAAVIVAAQRRARRESIGEALARNWERRRHVQLAASKSVAAMTPTRLLDDGQRVAGEPPGLATPLRVDRREAAALERERADVAAIERLRGEVCRLQEQLALERKRPSTGPADGAERHPTGQHVLRDKPTTAHVRFADAERGWEVERAQTAQRIAALTLAVERGEQERLALLRDLSDMRLELANRVSALGLESMNVESLQAEHAEQRARDSKVILMLSGSLKRMTERLAARRAALPEAIASSSPGRVTPTHAARQSGVEAPRQADRQKAAGRAPPELKAPAQSPRTTAGPRTFARSIDGVLGQFGALRETLAAKADDRPGNTRDKIEDNLRQIEALGGGLVAEVRRTAALSASDVSDLDRVMRGRRDVAAELEARNANRAGADWAARIREALPPRVLLAHVHQVQHPGANGGVLSEWIWDERAMDMASPARAHGPAAQR